MREFRNIANLVRKHRIKLDMSQTYLSNKLGYKNGQFISNLERNLCSIPEDKIFRLSKLIDVQVSEIIEAMTADFMSNTIKQAFEYKDQEIKNETENKNFDVNSQGRSPDHLPVF